MSQVTPYNTDAGKKKEVEDMFDNIAPKYDLLNHVLSMKIDVLWRNTLVKWMNKDQPKEVKKASNKKPAKPTISPRRILNDDPLQTNRSEISGWAIVQSLTSNNTSPICGVRAG